MSDPRFARLKSDPRFRRPRRKQAKLVVDDRFKGIFAKKKKKSSLAQVDKYGRPIPDSQDNDNLRRFYRLGNQEEEEDPEPPVDYARGEVLLESSDEDESPGQDAAHRDGIDSDDDEGPLKSDAEVNLDETNFADLDGQAAAYTTCYPETEEQTVEPTRRLAAVNLDWEHVRAIHLFKICSSLLSSTASVSSKASASSHQPKSVERSAGNAARGKVISVRVYPSEFGKERIAREEIEGPPPEIFKKNANDEDLSAIDLYDVGGEEDYDVDALRKYQLERLRYYYAIIICDTIQAATHLYTELDGTELERSANVFDLSYVPDDMTFDKCRDEATGDPDPTFKGIDFVTDALRHSKVNLTWDDDDRERAQITRRTLTRKEIDNADFRAYLASSDSDIPDAEASQTNKEHKKPSRDKLRSLLLDGTLDDLPEGWGRDDDDSEDIDMQITFRPGLKENKGQDETTLEAYQRKMREKRKKRKEEANDKPRQQKTDGDADGFFDVEGHEEAALAVKPSKTSEPQAQHTRAMASSMSHLETTPEELALLLGSDNPNAEPKHFNLKSVLKSEKKLRRKEKWKRDKNRDDNEFQADFSIDVKDERFTVLHEDPQFAIDPTNPHFKKTNSMTALLNERSRRQNSSQYDRLKAVQISNGTTTAEGKGLNSLVESVKRKSATSTTAGSGKRRKL